MFPLHVWMTGSGTQFNMNVNEVISNRCCQLADTPLGSKKPVHPNDHVNMSQSSNDNFPSAMYVAAAVEVTGRLMPAVKALHDAIDAKAKAVGRHRQDRPHPHAGCDADHARPGMVGLCRHAGRRSRAHRACAEARLPAWRWAARRSAPASMRRPGFAEAAAAEIAKLTDLPFVSAPNKFTVQGSHDALVQLSGHAAARSPSRSTRSPTTSG